MSIQSLSIVVPGRKCINNCEFCVSRTHSDIKYKNSSQFGQYERSLLYAKDLGCTTLMLTGECEPQQNMPFVENFLMNHLTLFHNIEIQTTGRGLDAQSISKLAMMGVNTFSISMASFDQINNSQIINQLQDVIEVFNICKYIKANNLLLRLSLNLNDEFYSYSPAELFHKCKNYYGADQVTLRMLYKPNKVCSQSEWIDKHVDHNKDLEYFDYIKSYGDKLETLPYGKAKYSVDGVGTVADDDCMAKANHNDIRYLILRPDGHLYTRWDDPASIIR